MTAGYSLTPLAEGDLDDTWDYVADRFGFDVADGVLDSLHRAFQLLAEDSAAMSSPERYYRNLWIDGLWCHAADSRFSRRILGCRAAIRSSAIAGPSGFRRPCSQLRRV
jgi:plasmid stabilization system protein ParE